MLLLHCSDISHLPVGKTISQGEHFYNEGSKNGNSECSIHVHMACGFGQCPGDIGVMNWTPKIQEAVEECLFLKDTTTYDSLNCKGVNCSWSGNNSLCTNWEFHWTFTDGTSSPGGTTDPYLLALEAYEKARDRWNDSKREYDRLFNPLTSEKDVMERNAERAEAAGNHAAACLELANKRLDNLQQIMLANTETISTNAENAIKNITK